MKDHQANNRSKIPMYKKKIKDLTTHCNAIIRAIMITQIAIENVWNISHNALCARIILTYGCIMVTKP